MEEQESPDQFEHLQHEDTGTVFENADGINLGDDALNHEYGKSTTTVMDKITRGIL